MKIRFTSHAKKRARERGIPLSQISKFIDNPDKIERSSKKEGRILIKKVYFNKKIQKDHLLLIIAEEENNLLKVITVIDTSKISKYF